MGLFDQVISALNDPNQRASQDQLRQILGTVQQLTRQQGVDATTTQTLLSVIGNQVRAALQQKQTADGQGTAAELVDRYSGTQSNDDAVRSLFNPDQQRRAIETAAQATGLDANTIQQLLPTLIPIVLNLLQTGASTQPRPGASQGSNPVLGTFLDSDRDGDVDVGDAISLASQFLQSR